MVYGAWLETAFGLSIVAIGASSGVIGVAELTGELITVSLADRFGLKRLILLGACLTAAGNAFLPLFGSSLPMALTGLFMVYICFEFTFVSCLSLSTELVPGARATMMSGLFATAGAGRFIGAWGGGWLWTIGGINASIHPVPARCTISPITTSSAPTTTRPPSAELCPCDADAAATGAMIAKLEPR